MDPLAIVVATLVAKWAAEGFAKEAGKSAWSGLQSVYEIVRSKLTSSPQGMEVLERSKSEATSETNTMALAKVLDEQIKKDSDFAEKLRKLVENAEREPTIATFVTEAKDSARVGKIVNIQSARDVRF